MTEVFTDATEGVEPAAVEVTSEVPEALIEDDLLVEDVSIDGMCGVY